jgi:putative glutamine amidotransferase
MPPLIGVTGRRYPAVALYPDDAQMMAGIVVDAFFQSYARGIASAGGMVVFLPRESNPAELVPRLDGVLLAGGQDIDPVRYGGVANAETTSLDPGQDEFDLAIARTALALGVPLLGTCRGHEVLNVALGGTLRDHGLPVHNARLHATSHRSHEVRFEDGSLMHRLYGPVTRVNSLHHQAIDRVAAPARVTGLSGDDVVEAIELDAQRAVGVQWHPEFHAGVDPVLTWLVDAARERRLTPHGVVAS